MEQTNLELEVDVNDDLDLIRYFSRPGQAGPDAARALTPQGRRRLLDRINESYAREPVEADDIFLFPGVLSTQGIDSYGTRMAPSSMRAYRQTIEAEGVPLMNSHRTGGLLRSGLERYRDRWGRPGRGHRNHL